MEQNGPSWGELSQRYAMCARDFYEAVARLGRYRDVGPETVAHWQNIRKLHALCFPIEKEIDRRLGLEEWEIGANAPG